MKKLKLLLICVAVYIGGKINAQEITMDLGGPNHPGVYNTEPLRNFTKVKWKTKLDGNGGENFIIKNNILYVNGGKGNFNDPFRKGYFFAIDAATGKFIWKDSVNRFVSSPTMKDSTLYYGSDDRDCKIRALNKSKGKQLWTYPLESNCCWPPALYKEKAFFGDHKGNWYVINNITGKELYKQHIEAGICCVPSVVGSVVYYIDLHGAFHTFDANNYRDSVVFETGSGFNNPPVIDNNVAYIVNDSGSMFAFSLKTNKVLWTYKIDDTMYRSPSVSDKVLTVITSHGYIYAFDKITGMVLWKTQKPGTGYTNTSIAQTIVYAGCPDNHLYAFDLFTGKELWKFTSDAPVNTPLVDKGIVYFTSGNYLYAIE